MSRLRGIFPLLLATGFGIANGLWAFGPAFREQQEEKEEQARKALESAQPSDSIEKEALRKAEAEASRSAATESTLKPTSSSSWWNAGIWSKGSDASGKTTEPAKPSTKG